jgi:transposase
MSVMADHPLTTDTAAHSDQVALVLSLELSQSKWLVTSLSPGNDKISKHTIQGGTGWRCSRFLRNYKPEP